MKKIILPFLLVTFLMPFGVQVTTTSELKDVLERAKNGKTLTYKTEPAIGCIIKKIRKFW